MAGLLAEDRAIIARIAARRPRVQCVMNVVAQPLAANCLLAIGAEPSMAMHPAELPGMAAGADALLVNLGTFDEARERAIEALIEARGEIGCPVVIDPVFAERSSVRMALVNRLAVFPRLIVKGNIAEMAALGATLPGDALRVVTGEIDHLADGERIEAFAGGHPLMAKVSGSGCALGALIAAAAAVEDDLAVAARAALRLFKIAGGQAGAFSKGPGSFAVNLVDALHRMTQEEVT